MSDPVKQFLTKTRLCPVQARCDGATLAPGKTACGRCAKYLTARGRPLPPPPEPPAPPAPAAETWEHTHYGEVVVLPFPERDCAVCTPDPDP